MTRVRPRVRQRSPSCFQEDLPAFVHRYRVIVIVAVHPFADRYGALRVLHARSTDVDLDPLREGLAWRSGPEAWLEEAGPMAVPESLWLCRGACAGSTRTDCLQTHRSERR